MPKAIWINNCKGLPNWASVHVVKVQKRTARIEVRRSDGRIVSRYTKLNRLMGVRDA